MRLDSKGAAPKRLRNGAAAGGVADDAEHAWRHDNIGRLLLMVFTGFETIVFEGLKREGFQDIRQVHFNVMRHIDYDAGTRLVELARRAGITKGAMGQLVAECHRLGQVAIRPDPTDGRAKIISFTARGHKLIDRCAAIIAEIERDFAATVGARRYRELRDVLGILRDELVRQGRHSARPPRRDRAA
jgi:DNA-binding MarR family transcriptional regulator